MREMNQRGSLLDELRIRYEAVHERAHDLRSRKPGRPLFFRSTKAILPLAHRARRSVGVS
jgi:hypothetical protein